jgi:hypothetical protein
VILERRRTNGKRTSGRDPGDGRRPGHGGLGCRQATLKGQIDLPDGEVRDIAVRVMIPEKDVKPYLDGKATAARSLDERTTAVASADREMDAPSAIARVSPGGRRSSRPRPGHRSRDTDQVSHGPVFHYDPRSTPRPTRPWLRTRDDAVNRQRAAEAGQFAPENQRLADALTGARARSEAAHARLLTWETEMLADLPRRAASCTPTERAASTKVPRGDRGCLFASGEVKIGGLLNAAR